MSKWQRTYTLKVYGRSGTQYSIAYPLTCVFTTSSRAQFGVNEAHFMIYNLSPAVRNDIQFDSAVDIDSAHPNFLLPAEFYAGYLSEGGPALVFQGNIQKAFSYRDGPDVVTDITVGDGLYGAQQAYVAAPAAAPWTAAEQARNLVALMNPFGLTLGAIGSLFPTTPQKRGILHRGATWDILGKLAGAHSGTAFINQGKVYLLAPNDYLVVPGATPTLDSTTGLIGTPRRSGHVVDADMMFEPNVVLGQMLEVFSSVNTNINGVYQVQAISHRGTISAAKDGGVVTTFSLFDAAEAMNPVVPA